MAGSPDVWASGSAYEPYVGRWSRLVAAEFLGWLNPAAGKRWLDVGCGTGALTEVVVTRCDPSEVIGVDPSAGYVGYAREHLRDPRAEFRTGVVEALPGDGFDFVVSGLVLNFVPDPAAAVAAMRRAAPGGVIAAYVWDYAGRMELMRHFWDAAVELDPTVRDRDEGVRFPICHPDPLRALWSGSGLEEVATRAIDVPTVFSDFDDYWRPFLGGQAPAPGYAMSLSAEHREALRERIRSRLPIARDGSITLVARAWAVRGRSS